MKAFTKLRAMLLCLGAAAVTLSCTARREAPLPPVSTEASNDFGRDETSIAAAPPVSPPSPVPEAAITTIEGYKLAVARRILQSNPQHLYEGAPPPMLKSVVVLAIAVDSEGRPRVRVQRGNGNRALEQLALQSVQLAAPFPRPGTLAQRRGLAEFSETWLFRADGRFQLRSTAELQSDL